MSRGTQPNALSRHFTARGAVTSILKAFCFVGNIGIRRFIRVICANLFIFFDQFPVVLVLEWFADHIVGGHSFTHLSLEHSHFISSLELIWRVVLVLWHIFIIEQGGLLLCDLAD